MTKLMKKMSIKVFVHLTFKVPLKQNFFILFYSPNL